MFPLLKARLGWEGQNCADPKIGTAAKRTGKNWKELQHLGNRQLCAGYGLFGMVEQQHSDIQSALARGSQGETIELEVFLKAPLEILPRKFPVSSLFQIFPHTFLMDIFHETSKGSYLVPCPCGLASRPAALRCAQRMRRLAFGAEPDDLHRAIP